MKRRYCCAVIGTGKEGDAVRPKIADHNVAWAVVEQFTPGAASVSVEVMADAATHLLIALDPAIQAIP